MIIIYVRYACQRSTKMDEMLAFLLLFYWRSFTTRRAIMLRNHCRLFEAQRRVEFARWQLRRRRILMTLVIATMDPTTLLNDASGFRHQGSYI